MIKDTDLAGIEVKGEEQKKFIKDVTSWTPAEDKLLMSQIDRIAIKQSKDVVALKPSSINPADFTISKELPLMKKDDEVLRLRCKLLISLVKAWLVLNKISTMEDKDTEGSLAHLQFAMKFLVPSSVLNKIVDEAC